MLLVDFGAAVKFDGVVGADASGTRVTVTTAPVGDTDLVVICMPVAGSTNERPTGNGASANVFVSGVASRSCDCTTVAGSGAMRIVMPFTAGSPTEKLSNTPVGWRYSNWKYVPSLRGMRRRRGYGEPVLSAGARA